MKSVFSYQVKASRSLHFKSWLAMKISILTVFVRLDKKLTFEVDRQLLSVFVQDWSTRIKNLWKNIISWNYIWWSAWKFERLWKTSPKVEFSENFDSKVKFGFFSQCANPDKNKFTNFFQGLRFLPLICRLLRNSTERNSKLIFWYVLFQTV